MLAQENKKNVLEELKDVTKCVELLQKRLGLSLRTVKGHLATDHFQMDEFEEIAKGFKDWNKLAHQTYKRITSQGKICAKEQVAEYYARQESLFNNMEIQGQAMKINLERKRNFEKMKNPVSKDVEKEERDSRKKIALDAFKNLYEQEPTLETDVQRNLKNYRWQSLEESKRGDTEGNSSSDL